jgi:hypothetical protein
MVKDCRPEVQSAIDHKVHFSGKGMIIYIYCFKAKQ